MKFNIKYIAQLARLKLTDQEASQYRREISGIVRYFEKLAEINITKEEATVQLAKADNLLRLDIINNCLEEEKVLALKQAPKKKGKFIAVPRIFEL